MSTVMDTIPLSPFPVEKKSTVTKSDQRTLVEYNIERHHEFRVMLISDRDNASRESEFLISYPPKYPSDSPFGRAYDLKQSRFVSVKDYWRPVGSDKEGDIYKILVENNVPHIAPFGKGNDVRDNVTVTDQLRNEEWACSAGEMVPLCNYRMSLDEVGRRLNEFKSSREFVGAAVADAMEGKVLIASSLFEYSFVVLQRMILLSEVSLMPDFSTVTQSWECHYHGWG